MKTDSKSSNYVQLFDRHTIGQMDWPETEEGQSGKKFLVPLLLKGVNHFIDNIRVDIFILKIDRFVFPVRIAKRNYDNSFVSSPYGQCIAYAKNSMRLIGNRLLEAFTKNVLSGLGLIYRLGSINSVLPISTETCLGDIEEFINAFAPRFMKQY